ncbi:MAG: TIGR04551 family protein [Deltaproteobacteria bacterium]|nr:TIGR04551 family protein [Deltaproteobacteria bacterium]
MRNLLSIGMICFCLSFVSFAVRADDDDVSFEEDLPLVELHGYYRFRADLFDNFDLNQSDHNSNHGFPEPLTEYNDATRRGANTIAGANMRFRIDPTVNIHKNVRIFATIDMLDNLVLGSTPDSYPFPGDAGLGAFSQTQVPPASGVNSLKDSIQVKRIWGEIKTPLGVFRVGRMGSQWGMGLLANAGNKYDDDYGDSVDRVMFITGYPAWDLYVVPAMDWVNEGPTSARHETPQGQPFDLDQLDDANQYILAVVRKQSDEDIKKDLEKRGWALNGGMYNVFRKQVLAIESWSYDNEVRDSTWSKVEKDPSVIDPRNAELWVHDIWARLDVGRLAFIDKIKLEVEGVWLHGDIGSYEPNTGMISNPKPVEINQIGFVGDLEAGMFDQSLKVGFQVGYASGDMHSGFGVYPFYDSQKDDDDHDGKREINNFRFDPDYHVDLILWREIIGTVTDAIYFKPRVQYELVPGLGAKAAWIYSMAEKAHSTPSAGYGEKPLPNASNSLGLEMDVSLFYHADEGYDVDLEYGVLFPFDGMERRGPGRRYINGPDPAQTIQFRVTWHF